MAAPTAESILGDIRNGNISPVYLLTGEEPFFIDQIADALEAGIVPDVERDFNLHKLYGLETDMKNLVSICRGYPMMGARQVIIVREAQDMKEWKDKSTDKTKLKEITAYCANPVPTTVLVLAYKYKKIDNRLPAVKHVKEKGTYYESVKLRDYQLEGWISKHSAAIGVRPDPEAVSLLAEFMGANPSAIAMELQKLGVAVGDRVVNKQDIADFIGISRDFNVFELQKALGSKNVLMSNTIINHFASNAKENPIQATLPALFQYFVKVGIYSELSNQNTEERDIIAALGVNPYFIRDYKAAARNFPSKKIKRIFGYLREADRRSKGIENRALGDEELMKELVFKILH